MIPRAARRPRALIVFGEDWGAHPSSTQHLVHRLAADRPVVWVNSIGLRRPRWRRHDGLRLARKLAAAVAGGQRPASPAGSNPAATTEHFDVVAPLVVPVATTRALRAVNRRLLAAAVGRVVRSRGIADPILWISLPTAVDAVGALGERGLVYYCCDDWRTMAGVDGERVAEREAELVDRADLVLAASAALAGKFPAQKTVILPHGVDVEHFGRAAPRPVDLPGCGPIAGFYGSLSDWLDRDLLVAVAQRLPDWHFVLVGPQQASIAPLQALPNVILTGPRPHAALPGYVQHWTVSLIPFRDTPQIRACNPLKLREYLAAGTPIVATDFPALDGYRDLVEVGCDPAAFIAAMRRAAAEGGTRSAERKGRVAGESWQARAAMVSDLLAAL
jgi:glycosyltransferase involved in cell wall biosynthesis